MKYSKKETQDMHTGLMAFLKVFNSLGFKSAHLDAALKEAEKAAGTPSASLRDQHMNGVTFHIAEFGRGGADV